MKVWQLKSICRDCQGVIDATLSDPQWTNIGRMFERFDEAISRQDPSVLDTVLPSEFVEAVLRQHHGELNASDEYVRVRKHGEQDQVLKYLEVYLKYGGDFLEDVLEYGIAKIPHTQGCGE